MQDAAHRHILSPLCELNVGLVSQFVLDYMHLVCLGVVRKPICLWIGGPLKTRLPSTVINTVSQCLHQLGNIFLMSLLANLVLFQR